MSAQNVISLNAHRRERGGTIDRGVVAALVLVIVEAMMFAGMVSAFLVTRATAGGTWPPAGQPWFPLGETAVNTAALLASGALVFRAARMWQNPQARIGPPLLAAITLGAFFLFFQGIEWVALVRDGLAIVASHHGKFFCLIVGMHAAHALGALTFLSIVWLRLKPFRDEVHLRGSLRSGTFRAACILWYFAVVAWPVLYLCLYL